MRHLQLVQTVLAKRLRKLVARSNDELQTVLDLLGHIPCTSVIREDDHTVGFAELEGAKATHKVEAFVDRREGAFDIVRWIIVHDDGDKFQSDNKKITQ